LSGDYLLAAGMRKKLSFYLVIPQERESHLISCSIRHYQDDDPFDFNNAVEILPDRHIKCNYAPTTAFDGFFDGGSSSIPYCEQYARSSS
jgi:hypothetical protein